MSNTNLTVSVSTSKLTPPSNFLFNLKNPNSYSHIISRSGGFDESTFNLISDQQDIENWFTNGLGRHIQVYNSASILIWEGIVNEVNIIIGNLSTSSGKLIDIVNKLNVKYSVFIANVNGAGMMGSTSETGVADNLTSQGIYGIRYKVGQTGGISAINALPLRDDYLKDLSYPKSAPQLTTGSGEPSVTINCIGYSHLLDYPFTSNLIGNQNISDLLIEIIQAEPNGFVSSDTSNITLNTKQRDAKEITSKKAITNIQSLVNLGDNSGNFYEWGLYEDRTFTYKPIPNFISYQIKLKDSKSLRITNLLGQEILPQNVKPGLWLFIADFLIGETPPTDLLNDPRTIFIESVLFTAPNSALPRAGNLSTIKQVLNNLGLGGIGL